MLGLLPDFRQNAPWYLTVLTVILITATAVFGLPYALRVWKDVKEGPEDESTDPEEIMGPLTDAYAAGEISREEYERVRESVERSTLSEVDRLRHLPRGPKPLILPAGGPPMTGKEDGPPRPPDGPGDEDRS